MLPRIPKRNNPDEDYVRQMNKTARWIEESLEFARSIPSSPPKGSCAGRGIVIAGGGPYWASAYVNAKMLRHLGSDLPIQVWHLPGEHHPFFIDELKSIGVETIDSSVLLRSTQYSRFGGFELKLFSVMNSPFEEVLFLDADVYACQNPNFLFENSDYQEKGGIYWPDMKESNSWTKWDFWGVKPYHPDCGWETGEYLVNKTKAWQPLQMAQWYDCRSDWFYKGDYGDKGPHRVGWAMFRRSPHFFHTEPSCSEIGFIQKDHLGHPLFVHRCRSKFVMDETDFDKTPQYGHRMKTNAPLEGLAFSFLDELSDKWRKI